MTTIRVDLSSGVRTYVLPLLELPYQSSLSPESGTLELQCAPDGRITGALATLRAPREAVLKELARLAAEASWQVPADEIRAAHAPTFVVTLALHPGPLAELPPLATDRQEQRLDPVQYGALMNEANYTLENLEIAEGAR
jgi:hypothetical protein